MTSIPLLEQITNYVCEHFQLEEDKVALMLPTFLTSLQNHLQNLEEAVGERDPEAIGRAGHALKGALLNLGLDDMAEIALKIESEGTSGNSAADYASLLKRLREKMVEILQPDAP